MRSINRMNDYFVRYLLGSVGNEDILENIVNAVLEDLGFVVDRAENGEIAIDMVRKKNNEYWII